MLKILTIKVILMLAFTAAISFSCSKSKGTMADIIENVLEENQGIKIEITPQKELK
jgi:hypothetical protein